MDAEYIFKTVRDFTDGYKAAIFDVIKTLDNKAKGTRKTSEALVYNTLKKELIKELEAYEKK